MLVGHASDFAAVYHTLDPASGSIKLLPKWTLAESCSSASNAITIMSVSPDACCWTPVLCRPLTAAVAAAGRGLFVLDGTPRMRERPIQDLIDGLTQLGVDARCSLGTGCPPVEIRAKGLPTGMVCHSWAIMPRFACSTVIIYFALPVAAMQCLILCCTPATFHTEVLKQHLLGLKVCAIIWKRPYSLVLMLPSAAWTVLALDVMSQDTGPSDASIWQRRCASEARSAASF